MMRQYQALPAEGTRLVRDNKVRRFVRGCLQPKAIDVLYFDEHMNMHNLTSLEKWLEWASQASRL